MKVCSIEGCGRPVFGREWCRKHYERWLRRGDPNATLRRPPIVKHYNGAACVVEGCEKLAVAYGHCAMHRTRLERYGEVGDAAATRDAPYNGAACSVEGCEKPARTRGMCWTHRGRLDAHGDVNYEPTIRTFSTEEERRAARLAQRSIYNMRRRARKRGAYVDEDVSVESLVAEGLLRECGYCGSTESLSVEHTEGLGPEYVLMPDEYHADAFNDGKMIRIMGLDEHAQCIIACRSCNSSHRDHRLGDLPLSWWVVRRDSGRDSGLQSST